MEKNTGAALEWAWEVLDAVGLGVMSLQQVSVLFCRDCYNNLAQIG